MAAVQIDEVEVGRASGGPVVQAVMTLDCLPERPRQWRDVAVALARALEPHQTPVDGVYAVFDTSSAVSAVLEFGRVLDLDQADADVLRRLGAGSTVAYAAVRRGKGGQQDGQQDGDRGPVLSVTVQAAPRMTAGVLGRLRAGRPLASRPRVRRPRASVIAVVGGDGELRHLGVSRRPGDVGGYAAQLAAAYSR